LLKSLNRLLLLRVMLLRLMLPLQPKVELLLRLMQKLLMEKLNLEKQ
jgi:hypothetical protein